MNTLSFLRKQLQMHDKVTKRMQLTFCLRTFTLKYEHVSAVESAPDGSSGNTPTFEAEIKGVLKVTIESHLKMHMICLAYFSVCTLWMAP